MNVLADDTDVEAIQRRARAKLRLPADEIGNVNTRVMASLSKRVYFVHMLRVMHDTVTNTCSYEPDIADFCGRYASVVRHPQEIVDVDELSYALHPSLELHEYVMGLVAYFCENLLHTTVLQSHLTVMTKPVATNKPGAHRPSGASLADKFLSFFGASLRAHAGSTESTEKVFVEYIVCVDLALSNIDKIAASERTASVVAATRDFVNQTIMSPRGPIATGLSSLGSRTPSNSILTDFTASTQSNSNSNSNSEPVPPAPPVSLNDDTVITGEEEIDSLSDSSGDDNISKSSSSSSDSEMNNARSEETPPKASPAVRVSSIVGGHTIRGAQGHVRSRSLGQGNNDVTFIIEPRTASSPTPPHTNTFVSVLRKSQKGGTGSRGASSSSHGSGKKDAKD